MVVNISSVINTNNGIHHKILLHRLHFSSVVVQSLVLNNKSDEHHDDVGVIHEHTLSSASLLAVKTGQVQQDGSRTRKRGFSVAISFFLDMYS